MSHSCPTCGSKDTETRRVAVTGRPDRGALQCNTCGFDSEAGR
jgi:predicted RNA-binding Zn-ribbon protein involved in translation (DUF1610 family)